MNHFTPINAFTDALIYVILDFIAVNLQTFL
jgi:hypothetical protein